LGRHPAGERDSDEQAERTLYRRIAQNPMHSSAELLTDDPDRPLRRVEIPDPRGEFVLLAGTRGNNDPWLGVYPARDGIVVVGEVGITSHFGDVLRRAGIPSRIGS
jgi:hypothetical protein